MVSKKIWVEDTPLDRVEVVLRVDGREARMVWAQGCLWMSPTLLGLPGAEALFHIVIYSDQPLSVRMVVDDEGPLIRVQDVCTSATYTAMHNRFLELVQGGADCG
jgi:hypothetical protein